MENFKFIRWFRLMVLLSSAAYCAQAAVCPASLYFYAAETTDDREIFLRVNASNFEDCVKKCYSSDFCFSSVYTPRPGDTADCRLSYVAAYNCSHKVLINTYSNPNRPATAECIRCPALGEFISPPVTVQPNFGTAGTGGGVTGASQSNTAVPATPEATKVTTPEPTKASTQEVTKAPTTEPTKAPPPETTTSNETSLQHLTFEVDEIDTQELGELRLDLNTYTRATDVAQCARMCYEKHCTFSVFAKANTTGDLGYCYINFNGTQVCSGKGRVTEYSPKNETYTLIQCPLLKSVIIEPPPTSITKSPTEVVDTQTTAEVTVATAVTTAAPKACDKVLTFNILDPARKASADFNNHTEAVSAADCAKQCYVSGCTIAGFAPSIEAHSQVGSCLMSFGFNDCSRAGKPVTSYDAVNGPVQIQCIKCEESGPAEVTTTAPAEICTSTISFKLALPKPEQAITKFTNIIIVPSAMECASICFHRKCTVAGYIPISATAGNCMLSFDKSKVNCLQNDSSPRASNYTENEPTLLTCLICESTQPPKHTASPTLPALPPCSENVTFEAREPSADRVYVYTETLPAASGQECAQLCYQRRCTHANYFPDKSGGSRSSCSLGYHDESCNINVVRQSAYSLLQPIEFHCVRCEKKQFTHPVISSRCLGNITFQAKHPPSNGTVKYVAASVAENYQECLQRCYRKKCTVASFKEESNSCLLAFEQIFNKCENNTDRSFAYNGSTPVEFHCIECGEAVIVQPPVIVPINPIQTIAPTEKTNPASTTEVPTTITPKEITTEAATNATEAATKATEAATNATEAATKATEAATDATEAATNATIKEITTEAPPKPTTVAETTVANETSTINVTQRLTTPAEVTSNETTAAPTTKEEITTKGSYANTNDRIVQSCEDPVKFSVLQPDVNREIPFVRTSSVNVESVADCAQKCFERNCSVAGYLPSGFLRFCIFAYNISSNCSNLDVLTDYNTTTSIQIQCVSCSKPKILTVIEATPGVVDKGEVTTETTKSQPNETSAANEGSTQPATVKPTTEATKEGGVNFTTIVQACEEPVTFTVLPPEIHTSIPFLHASPVQADSVESCAQRCYERNCSVAGYVPAESQCIFAFEFASGCSNVDRYSTYNTSTAIQIQCLQCAKPKVLSNVIEATPGVIDKVVTTESSVTSQTNGGGLIIIGVNETVATNAPVNVSSKSSHYNYTNESDHNINSTNSSLTPIVKRHTTPSSHGESTAPPVVRNCEGILKFEATTVQPQEVFVHDFNMSASNADECSLLCYRRSCSSALYAPSTKDCRMSFRDFVCPKRPSLVSSYASDESAVLKCFTCVESGHGATNEPLSNISETTAASNNKTAVTHSTVRSCEGILKFEVTLVHPQEEFYNEFNLSTSNADECALLCYRRSCSSLLFIPSSRTSKKGVISGDCRMSFSWADCPKRPALVSTTRSQQTVLLKCFACDESTSGGSWSFSTEHVEPNTTIVAETTQASVQNVTASEQNVTEHVTENTIGNKCQGILNFEVDYIEASELSTFSQSASALTVDECVKLCFNRGCTTAAYVPSVTGVTAGVCQMNFTESKECSPKAHLLNHYETVQPVLVRCFTCVASVIEVTPGTINKNITYPQQGVKDCRSVAFESVPPDPHKLKLFTNHSFASNASECALMCYNVGCVVAGFVTEPGDASEKGVCLLSFGSPSCSGTAKVTSVDTVGNIQMQCMECTSSVTEAVQATSVAAVEVTTVQSSNVTLEVTTVANSNATITSLITASGSNQACSKDIFYQVSKPTTSASANNIKQVSASSAQECAQACYQEKCSKALFSPATGSTKPICGLIFDAPVECAAERPSYVWLYSATEPVQIQCVICSNVLVPLQDANAKLATVTANEVYNFTKLARDQTKPDCSVIYEESEMKTANFEADFVSNVQTSAECAKDCYVYDCTEAHFIPVAASNNHTSRCLLFFSTKRGNCSDSTKYAYHNADQPLRISCVSCIENLAGYLVARNKGQQTPAELIATPPTFIEKATDELINVTTTTSGPAEVNTTLQEVTTLSKQENETTVPSNTNYTRTCNEGLQFHVTSNADNSNLTFTGFFNAPNGYECAMECYKRGCNLARFSAENKNTGKPAECQFSYDADICQNDEQTTTANKSVGKEVRLQCIKCGSHAIEPAPVTVLKQEVTAAIAENITETTIRYVTGGGFEPRANSTESLPTVAGINGNQENRTETTIAAAANETFPTLAVFTSDNSTGTTAGFEVTSAFSTLASSESKSNSTATLAANLEASNSTTNSGQTCANRVTFQVQPATDLKEFTNSVKAYSASDCAKLCFEKNCQVAAYIPTPESFQAGICLLSNKKKECSSSQPKVPQEYRTYPFILNCIECSPCSFNLRTPDPDKSPNYDVQEKADSMIECAQKCAQHKCSSAAYTSRTSGGTCLIDTKSEKQCQSSVETRVETNDNLPVILDCVQCNAS